MSALRSRTMPLMASCILFVTFFFTTIHMGEGVKCYVCLSEVGGNCTTLSDIQTVECSSGKLTTISTTSSTTPSTTSTTPSTTSTTVAPASFQSQLEALVLGGANSLLEFSQQNVYQDGIEHACFYESATVIYNNTQYGLVARGCAPINWMDCIGELIPELSLKHFEHRSCDTDHCNSSGEIQIGMISLFLPLIASLFVTR